MDDLGFLERVVEHQKNLEKMLEETTQRLEAAPKQTSLADWLKIVLGVLSITGLVYTGVSYFFLSKTESKKLLAPIIEKVNKNATQHEIQRLYNQQVQRDLLQAKDAHDKLERKIEEEAREARRRERSR